MTESERRVEAMMAAIAADATRKAKESLADSSPPSGGSLVRADDYAVNMGGVGTASWPIDVITIVQPRWYCDGSVRGDFV